MHEQQYARKIVFCINLQMYIQMCLQRLDCNKSHLSFETSLPSSLPLTLYSNFQPPKKMRALSSLSSTSPSLSYRYHRAAPMATLHKNGCPVLTDLDLAVSNH